MTLTYPMLNQTKRTGALFAAVLITGLGTAMAQAKKPTLMVVPADVWMNTNGFTTKVDIQGTPELQMDYERALQTNSDLNLAISKIGELMADRGFPLQDLGQTIKDLKAQAIEDAVMDNSETMLDKLAKVAKCDIIMKLDYKVETSMKGRQLTFNLQGLDAYTNKQIAGTSGTSQPSNGPLAELLAEAAVAHLDGFNDDLTRHFDDLFAKGREVSLRVKVAGGSSVAMDDEFGGETLDQLIEKWVYENTVQHRFGSPDVGDTYVTINQVRIAVYGAEGRAQDARSWARGLQKLLKEKTGQGIKLMSKGLGTATLVIGGK